LPDLCETAIGESRIQIFSRPGKRKKHLAHLSILPSAVTKLPFLHIKGRTRNFVERRNSMIDKIHTSNQRQATRQNIKKAQDVWQQMSPCARVQAQPGGRERAKPGATGEGEYYHIEVRPKEQFMMFRTHDVGKQGGIELVAGKRPAAAPGMTRLG
jgi:hypothetical protein